VAVDQGGKSRFWLALPAAGTLVGAGVTIATVFSWKTVGAALTAVGAVLGAAVGVYEKFYRPRAEEERARRQQTEERENKLKAILALWPPPTINEVDPYQIGVFRSTIAEQSWEVVISK
jgi:hypothetical protein